jgi:hypothetical protein
MAFVVFLYVDKPVAALQFDADVQGSISLTLDPSSQKSISTNRLPSGKLRVVIYGLNQNTFSGKFASVNGSITVDQSTVVGSDPNGAGVGAAVKNLSSPQNVRVTVKK